jgi:5-formaminoimidazole-4-carboxamide-1-beta-D-ribofuranosyl 5'-monophosphate synthetase
MTDMIHTDKVKLTDSGTVLFRAASREEAVAKVLQTLRGAEVEEYAPGAFLADFSDAFFYSVVRAVVEPMSEEGRYAVSFQEANRCRCVLYPFPSRKAWRRMDRIKAAIGGE